MKKIIFSMLALVAGGVALTSCEDKLDIPQKASLTTENFYQTDADAEKALASAYEGFQINTMGRVEDGPGIYTPARVLANHPGDDLCYGGEFYGDHEWGGSINEFRFLHTPEAIYHHYRGIYLSIYPDNLVLEYFANKADATPFMKQAAAEARVLRAYNYFLLASYWGTPPFVDHLLDASVIPVKSDDENAPEGAPKSQQAYFTWVGDECMKAVDDLSERASTSDKEGAYRVTKGFALAMAGKAYMFAGDFSKAKDCLKKVIDSGKYALVPGSEYMDQFHIQGDGSPEKMFEVNFRYNAAAGEWNTGSGLGWNQHSTWMEPQSMQIRSDKFKKQCLNQYTGSVAGWGSIGIPEWYGQAFSMNDNGHADPGIDKNGKETYKSDRYKATIIHIADMIYGETGIESIDTYYSKMPAKHADRVKSTNIGIKAGRKGHYGQSFWVPIKHVVREGDAVEGDASYGSVHRLNNIIIMRYAEVLLNYAECCLRTNDAATAKTYINMIQQRAGSKTISDNVDLITLKKEKSFELWFESCRYQDIMRWSKLDNDSYDQECIARLKEQGKHIPHLCDKLSEKPSDIEGCDPSDVVWENGDEASSRFFIFHTHEAQDAGFEVGWQEKHRLFPYPQQVKDMNPNLRQVGWDY